MDRFRRARERIAAMRDEDRQTRTPWGGVRVEAIAEEVGRALVDRIAYRGGRWIALADGRELSRAVVVAAVADRLAESIEPHRRTDLANVIVGSATFREALSARRIREESTE